MKKALCMLVGFGAMAVCTGCDAVMIVGESLQLAGFIVSLFG